jgi:NAD-dependent SIR2 family protein deacetylase
MRSAVFDAYEHGGDPKELLCELLDKDSSEAASFQGVDPSQLWNLIFQIATSADEEKQHIEKTPITDVTDIYSLICNASRIVVLIGAGASTGPDFRSSGGLYDSIAREGVLADPYDVFDLEYFQRDPSVFWRFAHLIFPAEVPEYSTAHYFIEELERRGKLLRLYSQNVDTLERGICPSRLRCVHGSWRENFCLQCGQIYTIEDLRPAVNAGAVPHCVCCGGLIKPGIVFFGQPTNLSDREVCEDAARADLLLVIGTSLQVKPISELPMVMASVPSILINREPVGCEFNGELIGDCTDILEHIEAVLEWTTPDSEPVVPRLYEPNKFIFPASSGLGTSISETGRSRFLVTRARNHGHEFE